MADEMLEKGEPSKATPQKLEGDATPRAHRQELVATDALSIASSLVSSVTDILKEMDEAKKSDDLQANEVEEEKQRVEMPKVEDVSEEEDEWSVVEDGKPKVEPDEEQQMIDESVSSVLSPVVLAKWDTELTQLHELGFLDDRKNIDALEHLEAAHMGVDSTEKVTVNAAVEKLLSA